MARRDESTQARLERDLAELKLPEIARNLREVLDEAARKGTSLLEILATLFGMEQTARQQRALQRRLLEARLPKLKTVAEYDFTFPRRIPKAAILRLFDCDFIPRHGCAVLIGPTLRENRICSQHSVTPRPSAAIPYVIRVRST